MECLTVVMFTVQCENLPEIKLQHAVFSGIRHFCWILLFVKSLMGYNYKLITNINVDNVRYHV